MNHRDAAARTLVHAVREAMAEFETSPPETAADVKRLRDQLLEALAAWEATDDDESARR